MEEMARKKQPDFNFDMNFLNATLGVSEADFLEDDDAPEAAPEQQEKSVAALRTKERHFERRVKSELALEQTLPWHFENGSCYHCISFGDVDSLTYLRVIIKQQPVEYVLLSTWCMAITDAEEIKKWLDAGYLKRIDFYVGEIFVKQYAGVYQYILDNCLVDGARVAVFRNHSKVMAGFGRDFDFAIASSANVNTNPRCENTTITIDSAVAKFYKEFYDDIKSFSRDCDNWRKYEIEGR